MKTHAHTEPHRRARRGRNWRDYFPLLVLAGVSVLVAQALQDSFGPGANRVHWMHDFMGFFLVVFALLKLFDLRGFADGFQMYDLLGKRFRPYALAYPFIELALGLAYLAFWRPTAVYLATVIILGFGGIGVLRALNQGLDVNCACMGNTLKVPLSSVAQTEDLAMAAMSLAMWLHR